MKFSMIFEGVDRASKVMNKIMKAEKQAAASMKAGSKAATSQAKANEAANSRLASAYSKVGNAGRAAYRGVTVAADLATRSVKKLNDASVKLAKTGLGQIKNGVGNVAKGFTLAAATATVLTGVAAGAAMSMIDVASKFEKFQTVLETTEHSSAKAKAAMAWVSDFAVKTPYELDQVMASFVKLRSNGLDPTNGLLQTLGDTSAAMGKPLDQAVEAMTDAVTGENERLKEFGITASKTANKITYTYTNSAGKQVQASVKANDRMKIQTKLMAIFNEKYAGAMDKLSATWEGMISNISDMWLKFQLMIMNAGLFDWLKGKLQLLLDQINTMAADGSLQKWAENIGTRIMKVLDMAWQFATRAYQMMKVLGGYLSTAADYVGGWENLAKVLAAMAFAPTLISTAAGLVQIAAGLSMLATAGGGMAVFSGIGLAFRLVGLTGAMAGRSIMLVGRAVMMLAGGSIWAVGAALKGLSIAMSGIPSIALAAGRGLFVLSRSLILMTLGAIRTLPVMLAGIARSLALMAISGLRTLPASLMAVARALIVMTASGISALPGALMGIARGLSLMAVAGLRTLPASLMAVSRMFVVMAASGIAALPAMLSAAGSAFMALGSAMMATPIGWIVAGIAAIAAGAYLIYRNWDKIGPWLAGIWNGVKQTILEFWNWLSSLDWMALFNFDWSSMLTNGLPNAIASLIEKFKSISLYDAGVSMIQSLWNGMLSLADKMASSIKAKFSGMMPSLPSWLGGGSPAPVQARAGGGSYGRGPLLVGERGPELGYASRGGYIAHHGQLQQMAQLSARISRVMGSVAVASGLSTSAMAANHADIARAQIAQVSAQSSQSTAAAHGGTSGVSLTYNPTIHIAGATAQDKQSFAQLLANHKRQLADMLAEEARRRGRREY